MGKRELNKIFELICVVSYSEVYKMNKINKMYIKTLTQMSNSY
jgi:hypothetical protein